MPCALTRSAERGSPRGRLTFRFGIWPDTDYTDPEKTPKVIPKEAETDLVSAWIKDPLSQDLILIPQTQIDRSDVCTLIRAADRDDAHGAPAPAPAPPSDLGAGV